VTSWGGCPSTTVTAFDTVAYDASTGARLGRAPADQSARLHLRTGCGGAPDGGDVYIAGLAHAAPVTFDTTTVAYDTTTGLQRWSVTHVEGRSSPTGMAATADGRRVVVAGAATAPSTPPT
jgi:outer membrane protein assembly factor BamB